MLSDLAGLLPPGELRKVLKCVNAADEEDAPRPAASARLVLLASAEDARLYALDPRDPRLEAIAVACPEAVLPDGLLDDDQLCLDVLFSPATAEFACVAYRSGAALSLAAVDAEDKVGGLFREAGYAAAPGLEEFAAAVAAAPRVDELDLPLFSQREQRRLLVLRSPDGGAARAQVSQRLQLLVALFVENGVVANMRYESWWALLVLDAGRLAGLLTLFPFPLHAGGYKLRLAQILVLPPFQRRGLCAFALDAVYDRFLPQPDCLRVSAEAPTLYLQTQRLRCLLRRLAPGEAADAARACRDGAYADAAGFVRKIAALTKAQGDFAAKVAHLLLFLSAREAGAPAEFRAWHLRQISELRERRAKHAKTAFRRRFVSWEGRPLSRMEIRRRMCALDEQESSPAEIVEDELARFEEVCRGL